MKHRSDEIARPSSVWPWLAITCTVVTWAAAFPAITVALEGIDPLPMAAVRFGLAAVLAIGWLCWRQPRRISARDFATLVGCGTVGIALYNVLLNSGQQTVSPGAASFIISAQPMFMAILAVVVLKEAFNVWSWLGASLGFAGLTVIALGQPGGLAFGAGSSLILAAAIATAVFSVMQRPLFARIDPSTVTAAVVLVGAVALAAWLPSGLRQFAESGIKVRGAIVFLAIFPAAIGQVCWSYAIRSFGAALAGQFLYLNPILASLISWVLLGDAPAFSTFIGGLTALVGVVMVNTLGRRKSDNRPSLDPIFPESGVSS